MIHAYALSGSANGNVATASRIATDIALPNAADVDVNARFPNESMAALAAEGFYGLCLPRESGGKGEGMPAFAGVVEELAGVRIHGNGLCHACHRRSGNRHIYWLMCGLV